MLSFLLLIALCLPGTKSPNGLEICETCSKGYYEVEYGQTNCTACPVGFTTKRRGARELSDCKGNMTYMAQKLDHTNISIMYL